MKHHQFEFEGKIYKLRIRAKDHADLNIRLGDTFLSMFSDEKKALDIFKTLPALLNVAMKPFENENGKHSMDDIYALVDRMVDAGWSTEQFVELEMAIAEASGFFPEGTVAQMKTELEKETAEAS
jgi:hypothetical protein